MKVKEYKFENTKVEVYDDAIQEKEEVQKILKRIGAVSEKHVKTEKRASA